MLVIFFFQEGSESLSGREQREEDRRQLGGDKTGILSSTPSGWGVLAQYQYLPPSVAL